MLPAWTAHLQFLISVIATATELTKMDYKRKKTVSPPTTATVFGLDREQTIDVRALSEPLIKINSDFIIVRHDPLNQPADAPACKDTGFHFHGVVRTLYDTPFFSSRDRLRFK